MTKLEQVARAAYEAECRWGDPTERSVPWDEIGDGWKARQMAGIRAAVEALRDAEALPEFPEWNAHLNAILSEMPDA